MHFEKVVMIYRFLIFCILLFSVLGCNKFSKNPNVNNLHGSFEVPPPPPPLPALTKRKYDSIFTSIKFQIDSLLSLSEDDPKTPQYNVELEFRECISKLVVKKSRTDSILLRYNLTKNGTVYLIQIGNSKGKVKEIEIIAPIHECLENIKLKTKNQDSFMSYLIVKDGRFY